MTDGVGREASGPRSSLAEVIETQRLGCELAGSPMYSDVLTAVAADVAAGGVCGRVLAPFRDSPFGDAILLRLLGAVHLAVLDGRAPVLARHYPSVGGEPGPDLGRDFVATVAELEPEVVAAMAAGVQTNEVGRSAALLAGYLEVARLGLPMRVFEAGASAGLNLWFDRYRYEVSDGSGAFGPAESPLRFVDPWFGPAPDLGREVAVAERAACDLAPIDPTTRAGRLRLRSYVWPDQPARRARLDAALDAIAGTPMLVERANAVDWLTARLAAPVPGTATVVVHSIVLQYLSPGDRRRLLAVVDEAGERATVDAPLAWLRMEPGGDQAEIRLTTWPGSTARVVARSSFHGPPVVLAQPARL